MGCNVLTTFQTVMRGSFQQTGQILGRPDEWLIVARDGTLLSVTFTGVANQDRPVPCLGVLGRKTTVMAVLFRTDNAGEHFSLLAALPSGEYTDGTFCPAKGTMVLASEPATGDLRLTTHGMAEVNRAPSSNIPAFYELGLLSFGTSLPGDIDARLYPTTGRALA